MRAAAIALACLAANANADSVRSPLDGSVTLVRVATDEKRWELGGGVTTGWRTQLDIHGRYYLSDTVTLGPRLRLDIDDATPRVAMFEFSKAIAVGKLLFADHYFARVKLAIEWGDGVVRIGDGRFGVIAFAGLGWRIQPSGVEWLLVDLRVRATLVPEATALAARATTAMPPELVVTLAAELGASISVLWPPRAGRRCVVR